MADASVPWVTRLVRLLILAAITGAGVACANLGNLQQIIQPPRFEQAAGQPAEIRLLGPSANSPVGGAGVRIWLAVTNPNPFGFTLSRINTTLML